MIPKTYQPKADEVKRAWHLFDAKDKILGRLSSDIAKILMGKHKPTYSQHMDSGDFVVVVNAEKVKLTGNKEAQKKYYRHSGYIGNLKTIAYSQVKSEQPHKIIEMAVAGMLPKNRLHSQRMTRLKVVSGPENPYTSNFKKDKDNGKES